MEKMEKIEASKFEKLQTSKISNAQMQNVVVGITRECVTNACDWVAIDKNDGTVIKIKQVQMFAISLMLFFFIFIHLPTVKSQSFNSYYKYVKKAEYNVFQNNPVEAFANYEEAFKNFENPFMADYIQASRVALKLGKDEVACDFIDKAIKKGYTLKFLRKDHALKKIMGMPSFQPVRTNYKDSRLLYLSGLDTELQKIIGSMVKQDQKVRGLFKSNEKMEIMDSINFVKLTALIKKYGGWIGYSLLGESFQMKKFNGKEYLYGISFLLRHFYKDQLEVLFPCLKKAIEEGNIYPELVASAIDYHEDTLKGESKYGTYAYLEIKVVDRTNGSYKTIPIQKIDTGIINKNRRELGLENIEEYLVKKQQTLK